ADALGKHAELETALSAFDASRRDHVRTYQSLSRLTTPIFQSDNPTLIAFRDRAVHRLSRVPMFRRAMLKTLAGKQVLLRGRARPAPRIEPTVSRGGTEDAERAAVPSGSD